MISKSKNEYIPIADYGIIGNLHTIALVSSKGSIDYMAYPRIDSPTVFTALLDKNIGGYFEITCVDDEVNYKQMYLPDTTVLLTRFLSERGVAETTDLMPASDKGYKTAILRELKVVRGKMDFTIKCFPSFDYAKTGCEVNEVEDGYVFSDPSGQQEDIYLLTSQKLELDKELDGVYGTFTLEEEDSLTFILGCQKDIEGMDYEDYLNRTIHFWRDWNSRSNYQGRWRNSVNRSAMTMKLLTSLEYGSVVAAGTFGLPERIGGERNWDYRFLWVRDAAFTMYAFLRLGHLKEAENFMTWIKKQCISGELQLIYKVDGSKDLEEKSLDHLEGYMGSRPVRIGNGASEQFQLDIYGELIDTIYLYVRYGGSITYDFWKNVEPQVEFVCNNWQAKDHGIWEVRSGQKQFLHSQASCWVALDRAIRIAEMRSFPSDINRWRNIRDEIFKDIFENFYNEELGAFEQYKGAGYVDASALLLPLLRLCSVTEPKWVNTLKQIKKHLVTEPLVYRYRITDNTIDGLEGEEGTFSICSFWYVECLARMGEIDKANLNFEKMLGYANHLGLFSEQLGQDGKQLGNFPQAFTHLSLISAAYQIDKQTRHKTDSLSET